MSRQERKKIWVTLDVAQQLDALRGTQSYDNVIRGLLDLDPLEGARWPFGDMGVGEAVSFNAGFMAKHHRALKEALRRAAQSGKGFAKDLSSGRLSITRVR
jgi:small ligand-binding sensory domain FIST